MRTCKKCGYINLINVPSCGQCNAKDVLVAPMRVMEVRQGAKLVDMVPNSMAHDLLDEVILDDVTDEDVVYTITFKNVSAADMEEHAKTSPFFKRGG